MNDNQADRPYVAGTEPLPESHGFAAYLLIESLLHELIARETITTQDAIGLVNIAMETEEALTNDREFRPQRTSAELLRSLSLSLHADVAS